MEMRIKKKTFEVWAETPEISNLFPEPVPAKEVIPKWYKDLSRYSVGNKLVIADNGGANMSVKTCMPFLDSLTSGYIIKLHCDILVEWTDDNNFTMKWTSDIPPLTSRGKSIAESVPTAQGYSTFSQAWEIKYCFKAPKGYSVLVTHPLNRLDLPFIATSGIVDADNGIGTGGVPFALKKGFSGIIEAGTPILQMIPFKREDWKKELVPAMETAGWSARPRNKITGWYKNEIWKRKVYE
jgi:hypothetical protein